MWEWRVYRWILLAILLATAIFSFNISSVFDYTLSTEILKGIPIQYLIGIAGIFGVWRLYKLGSPHIWRWVVLGVFLVIAFFNLTISSIIKMNLQSQLVGTITIQTAIGAISILGIWALLKRL